MLYAEKYCDDYFASFTPLSPVYCWGCNICNIKEFSDPHAFIDKLYETFHSDKYNKAYYELKYQQAMAGSGWMSDCSGFFFVLNSEKDRTAQGFYNECVAVGDISTIDLSHSCCIFKSKGTENTVNHIAWYNSSDGYVYEMANSEKNFQRTPFTPNGWNYWGKPAFVDYSSAPSPIVTKPYLYKGIDISTYQKNVNYQSLKSAGVDFVILKAINKKLAKDDMFETHYAGCQGVGIKVYAVYNYSYALNADDARRDANAVLKALEGRRIPICLDLENQMQTLIGHTIVDIINAYQEVVEQAGLPFILYTGLSFYNTYIKKYEGELHVKNLWIARYNKGYTQMQFVEDPDQRFKPMENILAWQYTSSGVVLGITSNVDLDIIYKELDTSIVPSQPSQKPVLCPVIKNTVRTKGGKLNVRNKPNTNGKVVGQFNNGQDIIVVGVDKDSGWYRLAVTSDLWCSNEWVTSTGKGIVTAEKSLNIRSSDSTKGEIWGTYKHGDIVTLLHQSGNTGWYLTPKGWISDKYVGFQ